MTDTIGAQRVGDRRGWLVFEHLPDDLQNAEDTTQAHDFTWRGNQLLREYDPARGHVVRFFNRPATLAERTLLTHLGHELPETLYTRVEYLTETLRQRRWPQLEREDTTP
ncbi:hypothetical protein [Mycolicibacterium iranicum]|uniref:Transposase n=1 Tax=Mycolicibacterium iranicum TaxID=912594 RepID=A0ABT4HPR8_MYCIR|nr:hypothetical protein [Mycolicibacterium iranicum]MCZ0732215.1 hypothetical protein [Mycolicibacterium iranicum]